MLLIFLLGELKKSEITRISATLSFMNLNKITPNSKKPKYLSYDMALFEVMCLCIVYRNSPVLRLKIHIFSHQQKYTNLRAKDVIDLKYCFVCSLSITLLNQFSMEISPPPLVNSHSDYKERVWKLNFELYETA